MSVLSYLTALANSLKIQDLERASIDRSINNLTTNINLNLLNVQKKFVYGSYWKRRSN